GDGHLRIVDRKKELIINASGKNMSPANIEARVKEASPLIGQACVIGDARPYNVALIVVDGEAAATLGELGDAELRAEVQHAVEGAPADALALLAAGADVRAEVAAKAPAAPRRVPLADVALHAPIARPSKYLAIGFNYTSHLEEIAEAAARPEFAEAMQRFG